MLSDIQDDWDDVVSELRAADRKFKKYSDKMKRIASSEEYDADNSSRHITKLFMDRTKVLRSEYLMLWGNRVIVSKFYLESQNNKQIVMKTYMKAKKNRISLYSKIDNDPYFWMTYKILVKWEQYIYEYLLEEKINYYCTLPRIIPNEIKNDVTTYLFDRCIF